MLGQTSGCTYNAWSKLHSRNPCIRLGLQGSSDTIYSVHTTSRTDWLCQNEPIGDGSATLKTAKSSRVPTILDVSDTVAGKGAESTDVQPVPYTGTINVLGMVEGSGAPTKKKEKSAERERFTVSSYARDTVVGSR